MEKDLLIRKIDNAVENLEQTLINFALDIFSIPTQNPPGNNYDTCTKAIGNMMEKLGMEVQYISVPHERLKEVDPDGIGLPRINVVGTLKGEALRPNIHFTGHYDVVPEGENWEHSPYGCEIEDGKIYARGSADQKSGIVSQIIAIQALQDAGIQLKGTIISSASCDEESGGKGGVGYMVEQGWFHKENTDYCIITECLDVDKVCLGHRGTLWFDINIIGKQSHGSMPSQGVNPIEFAHRLLNNIHTDIEPLFEEPSTLPINPPECKKTTLTVTMIHAGEKVNTVPPSCKISFDWRLIPELSVSWAKSKIEEVCEKTLMEMPGSSFSIKYHLEDSPTLVSKDTEIVHTVMSAGEIFLGKEMAFSVSPGMDDQKYIVHKGGMEQCIVYGPGRLTLAHKSDEYAVIEEMKAAAKIMAFTAAQLLGVLE